jgi:nucleotide-binding universal stress UspA family protein
MFQRIFVPCDGSSASFQALDQALHIAQREGSTVTVLCIIDARVLDEPEIYLPIDDEIRVSTTSCNPQA